MVVLGQLGRGKSTAPTATLGGSRSALARWLCFEAMRRSDRPVVVLDGTAQWAAQGEPLDLSAHAGRVIDPLTFGHALSSSSGDTRGSGERGGDQDPTPRRRQERAAGVADHRRPAGGLRDHDAAQGGSAGGAARGEAVPRFGQAQRRTPDGTRLGRHAAAAGRLPDDLGGDPGPVAADLRRRAARRGAPRWATTCSRAASSTATRWAGCSTTRSRSPTPTSSSSASPAAASPRLVKAFMLRMIRYGYRSLVLGDVKDEYEDLARFLGVDPFRIGPGLRGPDQPARPRPARRGLGEADPRGAAPPRHRDLQPLAVPDPGPGRLPGRDVHPDRGAGHQQGAAPPHRLVCRRLPAQAGDHPAGVGGTGLAHRRPGRGLPLRLARRTSTTAPGRCATPSAPCARARCRACSTPSRPSAPTGAHRSRRCRCARCTRPATRSPSASR